MNKFFTYAGQFIVIGLLSLNFACKDEPARLEGGVLPENEELKGISYTGSLLDTRNTLKDAVRTDDAVSGIIGTLNDPEFGLSKADFLTDFSLSSNVEFIGIIELDENNTPKEPVDFHQFNNGPEWSVDSVVLSLQYNYNQWYGDMTSKHRVSVYELQQPLGDSRQDYYSNQIIDGMYNPESIAEKVVYANEDVPDSLKSTNWQNLWTYPDSLRNYPQYLWDLDKLKASIDSGYLDSGFTGHTDKVKNWNFKLNDDVRDRLFNLTESELQSTAAFKGAFNGIYVTSELEEGTEGSLTRINLLSTTSLASSMTLHYKRSYKTLDITKLGNDTIIDSVKIFTYKFPINRENVRFNRYHHEPSTNIKQDDPSTGLLYLQGMAGMYTKMQLPEEILQWADSLSYDQTVRGTDYLMSISNIELLAEVDTTSYAGSPGGIQHYPIPENLSIYWRNAKGNIVSPIYTTVIDGKEVSYPMFGSDPDNNGARYGIGERVLKLNEKNQVVYLYRFLMRPDFFTYAMRELGGGDLNEIEFYIGPSSGTSSFQRVILYSARSEKNPFNMNIKYFQYNPR